MAVACDSVRAPFIGRLVSIVRVIMPRERRALPGAWHPARRFASRSVAKDMPLRLRMRR